MQLKTCISVLKNSSIESVKKISIKLEEINIGQLITPPCCIRNKNEYVRKGAETK